MQNEVDTHSIEHLDFEHVLMCEARSGWCCDSADKAAWLVTRQCCEPTTLLCNEGLIRAYQVGIMCRLCGSTYERGEYVKSFVSVGQ